MCSPRLIACGDNMQPHRELVLVQQIMRWDMAVLSQSPWYQQILKEGEQRGRREERLSGIELGLEIKFGSEGLQLMPEISQISDLEQLKLIQQRIKTVNTLDELRELIRNIQSN